MEALLQQQQTATKQQLHRHHIEIAIVAVSGCRLCAALACSQAPGESREAQHSLERTTVPPARTKNCFPLAAGCWLDIAAAILLYAAGLCSEFWADRLGEHRLPSRLCCVVV